MLEKLLLLQLHLAFLLLAILYFSYSMSILKMLVPKQGLVLSSLLLSC